MNYQEMTTNQLVEINKLSADELKKRGIIAKAVRHHFVGQKIGDLTITEILGKTVCNRTGWQQNWFMCLCTCGENIKTTSQYLNTCKSTACCKSCQKQAHSKRTTKINLMRGKK